MAAREVGGWARVGPASPRGFYFLSRPVLSSPPSVRPPLAITLSLLPHPVPLRLGLSSLPPPLLRHHSRTRPPLPPLARPLPLYTAFCRSSSSSYRRPRCLFLDPSPLGRVSPPAGVLGAEEIRAVPAPGSAGITWRGGGGLPRPIP
ncbi:hypothetical protein U9M48_043930 [Paspalum notatum var. saurae]|uniref:Uncharacterized protein n=1 Tax=Paspalum notatum var. saurae TaxID=547442 RepID=A0AAQ3XG29_PASNO